ncbi:hypothetical protein FZC74_08000 [Sutcliffiella horikoshii]|uniref:Glycosyl hydrolase family 88 n=1 Tax=Sutcliffiella horikoshii TaxID=79883 RepID=A0AA95B7Y9_9BACI|nr:glycoside hydrolase family 88 protein [Sutcliffiella horikoshii]TYS60080.1 hypothetical protein FZC74_08000 [Sutcliffiella horikoshii]
MIYLSFFIVILVIIIIILIDLLPLLKTWIGRIHIGRYTNFNEWSNSVSKVGYRWLNNTPKIKVTDNNRLIFIDMIRKRYTNRNIQYWQEAALLLGLIESLKKKNDPKVKKEIQRFLKRKFDATGQWIEKPQHIDAAILAYAIMKIEFINSNNYNKAFDYTWELIKAHIGEDGTVGYRKSMMNYRYVDTIGFICPFLITYGIRYKKEHCVALSLKQIQEYERYGLLEYNLPSHAYDLKTKLPLGLIGWGRGLGWYAIGLMDSFLELPNDSLEKQVLKESVLKYAAAIVKVQKKNGSWAWTVTRKESISDSSTTATLGWFLANVSEILSLSEHYAIAVDTAIKYLMNVTRKDGTVDFSQGDTKDIGVYSMDFGPLPFTQGFCKRLIDINKKDLKVNQKPTG